MSSKEPGITNGVMRFLKRADREVATTPVSSQRETKSQCVEATPENMKQDPKMISFPSFPEQPATKTPECKRLFGTPGPGTFTSVVPQTPASTHMEDVDSHDERFSCLEKTMANLEKQLSEQGKQLSEQAKQLSEQDKQLSEQDKQLSEQDTQLSEQEKQLSEQQKQLSEQKKQLSEQEKLLAEQEKRIYVLEKLQQEGEKKTSDLADSVKEKTERSWSQVVKDSNGKLKTVQGDASSESAHLKLLETEMKNQKRMVEKLQLDVIKRSFKIVGHGASVSKPGDTPSSIKTVLDSIDAGHVKIVSSKSIKEKKSGRNAILFTVESMQDASCIVKNRHKLKSDNKESCTTILDHLSSSEMERKSLLWSRFVEEKKKKIPDGSRLQKVWFVRDKLFVERTEIQPPPREERA